MIATLSPVTSALFMVCQTFLWTSVFLGGVFSLIYLSIIFHKFFIGLVNVLFHFVVEIKNTVVEIIDILFK
jgi:hypothetical protein